MGYGYVRNRRLISPALVCTGGLLCALSVGTGLAAAPYFATGVKVGEVTDSSAIIWVRLTAEPERNWSGSTNYGGKPARGQVGTIPPFLSERQLEGACPGAPGRVRLHYGTREDMAHAVVTNWFTVDPHWDFTHQFRLSGLRPDTQYFYLVEACALDGGPSRRSLVGTFRTAPPPNRTSEVRFTAITCQMYPHLDDREGFRIYPAMARLDPHFLVANGDNVYYDDPNPVATTTWMARYKWHRMYSLPRLVEFHYRVPAYWLKDDHDTYWNDCWPTMPPKPMPLTFAEGQRIFLEQVPIGEKTYRTFRWGKALQIWLPEGRDFRSPNNAPDGPDKTIWGQEQMAWLKQTILASDAHFRLLISPTPIVGPDRTNKADNHANKAFAYEGTHFRSWVRDAKLDNFFVICGDRHWQYHSVDPDTGVIEFSCGPASDVHAGGSPGEDPRYHKFHRVKGGFLSVTVTEKERRPTIAFRFHDVDGNVVYEWKTSR